MVDIATIKATLCDSPIVIDDWRQGGIYGVYPKGTRDKNDYISPDNPSHQCLKANWRYLFKLSRRQFPWQFWAEIIAYRIGLLAGIKVPAAHIGMNRNYNPGDETYGALIEWFYDDIKDVYTEGGLIMLAVVKDYDREKGTEHNFTSMAEFFRILLLGPTQFTEFVKHWAGVFTLDCLTGNIDRHQDNWGLILKGRKENPNKIMPLLFSPAFDNGTALGYEILEENLGKYNGGKLIKYLTGSRARHHMKWSLNNDTSMNFYDFLQMFSVEFPEAKPIILEHLNFSRQDAENIMMPLLEAVSNTTYLLSSKRLAFMLELLFRRRDLIIERMCK